MCVVPYWYNINPSFQAPTRVPLGVTRKFLTYNINASLPFPLSCKRLETGLGILFPGGFFFSRIFRLIHLACQTVMQSSCLRSGWQGPSNGFCVSLQREVCSTSRESHSSNFFQLQEYKALAIPLTSHGFGLVFTPLDTCNACLLVFHVTSL